MRYEERINEQEGRISELEEREKAMSEENKVREQAMREIEERAKAMEQAMREMEEEIRQMKEGSAPAPAVLWIDDGLVAKGTKEVAAFKCMGCKKGGIRYDNRKSHVCKSNRF